VTGHLVAASKSEGWFPCAVQVMVNVQMLAELEEVIQFKLVAERREVIREMWWNRLRVYLSFQLISYRLCRCRFIFMPLSDERHILEGSDHVYCPFLHANRGIMYIS